MTRVLTVCLLAVVLVHPTVAGAGVSDIDQRALHQRLLMVLNRGKVNDGVVRFADDAAFSGGRGCDVDQTVAQCLRMEGIRGTIEARGHIATQVARTPVRPFWTNVATLRGVGGQLLSVQPGPRAGARCNVRSRMRRIKGVLRGPMQLWASDVSGAVPGTRLRVRLLLSRRFLRLQG
jgi:hypothetical protein